MLLITRRLRQLGRAAEVARVLVRYGGYHIVDFLGLRQLVPRRMRHPGTPTDFATKLRAAIEELGPTYVKLGQMLSTRPDIVPPRYLEELVRLQDTAPPVPFAKVRALVEQELGKPLEQAFRYFSETPLAAASLGQAHAALLPDGTAVVVKVQRPGIRRLVERDIEVLYLLAHTAMQRLEHARVVDLVDLVQEFQLTTRAEMDYLQEGRNMERLRENMREIRNIHVPAVYWEWTTSRVLTQERIHGVKITDVDALRAWGINPSDVARTLGNAFMKQIYLDGIFHADPHPGNLIVTDAGVVTLLDFGMVARLDEGMRESITRLFISFAEQDSRYFAEEILELGRPLRPVDRKHFTADTDRVLRQYYDLPAGEVKMGAVLNDTLRLCTNHLIQLPSNFGLVVRTLAHLDGVAKRLDPEFSYLEAARGFLGRVLVEQLHWRTLSMDLYRTAGDLKSLLLRLPLRTNQLMTKLVDGDLKLRLQTEGLDEMRNHLDKIGNRISYSLVVAALLTGSALFALARVPPFIRGYPVIGVATFLVAVVMGIWLLVAILRSGNLR